jgi:PadR family transcriptional regulator PadR
VRNTLQGDAMVEIRDTGTKLELELRRGALVLAVLSQLRSSQYGYSLRQALAERGMAIEEGTLYPLLRRLESQGLLVSEWRIEDSAARNSTPRRYYRLNDAGEALLAELTGSWNALVATMAGLLDGDGT